MDKIREFWKYAEAQLSAIVPQDIENDMPIINEIGLDFEQKSLKLKPSSIIYLKLSKLFDTFAQNMVIFVLYSDPIKYTGPVPLTDKEIRETFIANRIDYNKVKRVEMVIMRNIMMITPMYNPQACALAEQIYAASKDVKLDSMWQVIKYMPPSASILLEKVGPSMITDVVCYTCAQILSEFEQLILVMQKATIGELKDFCVPPNLKKELKIIIPDINKDELPAAERVIRGFLLNCIGEYNIIHAFASITIMTQCEFNKIKSSANICAETAKTLESMSAEIFANTQQCAICHLIEHNCELIVIDAFHSNIPPGYYCSFCIEIAKSAYNT